MKTVIRRYDQHRVAILPTKGFPEDYAKWLKRYAERSNWTDFKIVQTQDKWQQLGVVCRPKQWLQIIRYLKSKGADIPANLEEEFLKYSVDVLTETTGAIEKQATLTKEEKEAVKIMKDKALAIDIPEEEAEADTWNKEDLTPKPPKEDKLILPK